MLRRVRSWAVPATAVVLLGVAIAAIVHLLRPVSLDEIAGRIAEVPATRLILAGAAALASYGVVIGYDRAALRMLRKNVPAATVALGAFSGHAFANTLGWGLFSGGAVRYRLYARHGVGLVDIAAISAVTAAASGTGLALMCLAVLAVFPQAFGDRVPVGPGVSIAAGVGLVAACAAIAALSARATRATGRLSRLMPRPGPVLRLAVVVLAETGLAALALYVLIGSGAVAPGRFLAVFVAAMSLGLLSHVPGSAGVFEAVMLAGLGGAVQLADLAAALALFRVAYTLLPFAIAASLLATREVLLRASPAPTPGSRHRD